MDSWSKYQAHGLWGLWTAYFARMQEPFTASIEFGGQQWLFDAAKGVVLSNGERPTPSCFHWSSASGMVLDLLSKASVDAADAAWWQALLHYESQCLDGRFTFFPTWFPVSALAIELNGLIHVAPDVVLWNGQPGSGKKTLLEYMLLLHAGRRLESGRIATVELYEQGSRAIVIPEIAMLEIDEQKAVSKAAARGARCWAATVYDPAMLRARKILTPAFADLVESGRVVLPAVSRREPEEIETLSKFWLHFHGRRSSGNIANLGFLKQRVLGQAGLSVETILEEGRGLRGVIAEFEKQAILKAHARAGRSQHKIARLLKVSRGSLQHKLRKYQLESFTSPDADTEEA